MEEQKLDLRKEGEGKRKKVELRDHFEEGDLVKVIGGPDTICSIHFLHAYNESGWYIRPIRNQDDEKRGRWRKIESYLRERYKVKDMNTRPDLQYRYDEFTEEEKYLISIIDARNLQEGGHCRIYIDPKHLQYQATLEEQTEVVRKFNINVDRLKEVVHVGPSGVSRMGFYFCIVFFTAMIIMLLGCAWSMLVGGEPEATWPQWMAGILLFIILITGWSSVPLLKGLAKNNELFGMSPPEASERDKLWGEMSILIGWFLASCGLLFWFNFRDWASKEAWSHENFGGWMLFAAILALGLYPLWIIKNIKILFCLSPELYFANVQQSDYRAYEMNTYVRFYGLYDIPDKNLQEIKNTIENDKLRIAREEQAGCCNWTCPFANRQAIDNGLDRQKDGVACPDKKRCSVFKAATSV